jgi:hypothetical protein
MKWYRSTIPYIKLLGPDIFQNSEYIACSPCYVTFSVGYEAAPHNQTHHYFWNETYDILTLSWIYKTINSIKIYWQLIYCSNNLVNFRFSQFSDFRNVDLYYKHYWVNCNKHYTLLSINTMFLTEKGQMCQFTEVLQQNLLKYCDINFHNTLLNLGKVCT